MKRRPFLRELTRQITKLDAPTIDRLYGLEPVYEPDSAPQTAGNPTQFIDVPCPYCGETYTTQVDLTGGSFSYIEDCQVCCQPIELKITVSESGELLEMAAQRAD